MSTENDKAQYWRTHIEAWKASGDSQRRYCLRAGIALSSLDRWQRKLRSAGAPPRVAPLTAPALTLIPARVVAPAIEAPSHGTLSLVSPGGWQMTLPSAVEPVWLADVLKHLP